MKNVLSINQIINNLKDVPKDFTVNIQCFNQTINPIGQLIVYPGNTNDLAFDMSYESNVGEVLSYLNKKTYLSDKHYGTFYINRKANLWATFPHVHSNLILTTINVSEEKKMVTLVSRDSRLSS